jgi:hypothetical protein
MRARLMSGERLTAFARRAPTILTINTTFQVKSNRCPMVPRWCCTALIYFVAVATLRVHAGSFRLSKPLPVGSMDTLEGGHQRAHAVAELV